MSTDKYIGYLKTYGWMLLVVGIASAAVYSTIAADPEQPDLVDTGKQLLQD